LLSSRLGFALMMESVVRCLFWQKKKGIDVPFYRRPVQDRLPSSARNLTLIPLLEGELHAFGDDSWILLYGFSADVCWWPFWMLSLDTARQLGWTEKRWSINWCGGR
jgi:hypothetical protein